MLFPQRRHPRDHHVYWYFGVYNPGGGAEFIQDMTALYKAHARGSNHLFADGSVRYLDCMVFVGLAPHTLPGYDVSTIPTY